MNIKQDVFTVVCVGNLCNLNMN